MAWRAAKSLDVLLKQVNTAWPKRSKVSDGTIGDQKHSARKSDHNPNSAGVVCARDITHDPKHGLDARKLAEALVASKDPRIKYIISNGQICSGTGANHPAWKWRKYTGTNAHRKHVHISVKGDKAHYDSTAPWKLDGKATKPNKPDIPVISPIEPKPVPAPVPATDKEMIARVQAGLTLLKYNPGGADGIMGPLTKGAILAFRSDHDLPPGDFIDEKLIEAIGTATPRKMVPERANATVSEVAAKVPEAKVHWWTRLSAGVLGGSVGGVGLLDQITPAVGYLTPVKDFIGDVPPLVWIGGIVLVCGALYLGSQYGANKATAAYREGERR